MKADKQKPVALMQACERLPATMEEIALDLIARLQGVADDHVATTAAHEAQLNLLRAEVAIAVAKNAEMEAMLAAAAERTLALDQEVESLRRVNGALMAERDAHVAVEAAVAHHAAKKHQVDALLRTIGVQGHGGPMSRTEGSEATDANESINVDASPPLHAALPDPVAPGASPAAEHAAHERDFGEADTRKGNEANGRRVSGSPHIPS